MNLNDDIGWWRDVTKIFFFSSLVINALPYEGVMLICRKKVVSKWTEHKVGGIRVECESQAFLEDSLPSLSKILV